MSNKLRKYISILVLSISGGVIYLLPYIKSVFYDYQIEAMGITNQQSGLLMTMYSIGCMISYIPGGIIADKFSAKKCIFYSLIGTTVLTVLYGFTFNYKLSLIIWLLLAFTTSFVFWTALMKTIRMIGDEDEQGRMFGLYYAGNGITGAVCNSLALWASSFSNTAKGSLFNAVMVIAITTALTAVMIAFLLEDKKDNTGGILEENKFNLLDVRKLLKNPNVWIFSFIIFCGYTMYSSSTYFTPYLTNVVGISPEKSGVFSIIRTYIFMLLAPVAGYLADKVFKSTSKWFIIAFSILAVLFVGIMIMPFGVNTMFVSIYTLLPGAFALALYGITFSIMSETGIPVAVTGTTVGIACIIGYTPDLFMPAMFGTWLDNYGNDGYTYIFTFLICVSIAGVILSYIIKRRTLINENKIDVHF